MFDSAILPALQRSGRWAGRGPRASTRDGKPIQLWLTASLVRDAEGRPIAMVGLTRDLADQKKLEDEHVRTQKLESIGVLAGGLAHDFNNLLTIILGNLDLARLFAGSNPDAAEALDHASEAALRAGDLTRQLITFSKGGQPVKRVGSIARMVRETVLFAAAGSSVACEFAIAENLPAVDFDEGQMRQVIHNFVQNAREAMPGGGTLKVSACAVQLAHGEVAGAPRRRLPAPGVRRPRHRDRPGAPQPHLRPVFLDQGDGHRQGARPRARGELLDRAQPRRHDHRGLAGRGGDDDRGLPAGDDAGRRGRRRGRGRAAPRRAPPRRPRRRNCASERLPEAPPRGRVLVMDDEPLVLEMAGAALRRLGYAATLSRSGAEAIVQYQIGLDSGRRFDAVILDLTVPGGLGGPETLARLREIDPGVRAALSSGYTDHPAVTDWAGAGFAAFIAKPYSLKAFEELLATLCSLRRLPLRLLLAAPRGLLRRRRRRAGFRAAGAAGRPAPGGRAAGAARSPRARRTGTARRGRCTSACR